jgi:hypothetical protein
MVKLLEDIFFYNIYQIIIINDTTATKNTISRDQRPYNHKNSKHLKISMPPLRTGEDKKQNNWWQSKISRHITHKRLNFEIF